MSIFGPILFEGPIVVSPSWSPSVSSLRRIHQEYPLSECTPPQQLPQNHPPLPLRLVATPLSLCWYFLARVSRQSAWSHVRVLEKLQHAGRKPRSGSTLYFLLVNNTWQEVLPYEQRNSISRSSSVRDKKCLSEKIIDVGRQNSGTILSKDRRPVEELATLAQRS